ncbi:MAG: protein kinase, partial [Candidatus Obscuribacterales bacterium]|nr:protein kinase [Candidatus Obscuribacterales bacterium]
MAELNVTIKYRDPLALLLFVVMCVFMPVWLIIAPVSLFNYVWSVISEPGLNPPLKILTVFLSLFAFSAACIFATIIGEDNRIHISKDGIAFPLFLLTRLKFQRHASWGELTSANVVSRKTKKEGKFLMLGFESGASLALDLDLIKSAEQEQMLMAIELWATRCKRSPELLNYQKQLQNKGRTGSLGYTQMWEEELRRRFSATTFLPLEPGHKLAAGHLEITRQLAFGGLSALYLAQHKQRDMVVLKEAVIPQGADQQARTQAEEHIDRESKLLSKLRHPNIARVLDHFVEDGRHYIVLEFINGQDLRQYVKQQGVVAENQVLKWALDIARILVFLHSQEPPIIHRDLTPDNLVMNSSGEIILID